jgi:CelD/BcsL family acetyltransferase involved in cellulose biosynthesis
MGMREGRRDSGLAADLVAPRELGPGEIARWHAFMDADTALQSAFLSPEFARACEDAYGQARVAILHRGGEIVGFFPFQFDDRASRALGLAQRIGEEMSDVAGIVATEGVYVTPEELLRLCGLSAAYVSHVPESQERFGLGGGEDGQSFTIDVTGGSVAYIEHLKSVRPKFVADTLRKERKLAANAGTIEFLFDAPAELDVVGELMRLKREQYCRTGVEDVLARPARRDLIERLLEVHSPYCRAMLQLVRTGSGPIALHLGLRCTSTLHYWFPTYDPAFAYASPGRLMIWKMVEQAGAHAVAKIDLGAGEAQAKLQLSTGTYRVRKSVWSGASLPSLLARSLLSLRWRLSSRRRARLQSAAQADRSTAS